MTKDELNGAYFEWICALVCAKSSYQKLLYFLHNYEFWYTIASDGNRAEDGRDLRYRFGYEHNINPSMICGYLDDRECSVLEMLVSLAFRCEESIMDDPDIGDRTSEWFWGMVSNLGLYSMTDDNFDTGYVEQRLSILLNREYAPDGKGGLFYIENCPHDLRTIEIWYQMCWYLAQKQ